MIYQVSFNIIINFECSLTYFKWKEIIWQLIEHFIGHFSDHTFSCFPASSTGLFWLDAHNRSQTLIGHISLGEIFSNSTVFLL